MCFVTDYDWHASVIDSQDYQATKPTCCGECGVVVPIGGMLHHCYQQEHEECHDCYNGECKCEGSRDEDDCFQDHDCKCEDPDFGETFTYDRCMDCDKFLKAVEVAEVESGCGLEESRPYLQMMIEQIRDGGVDDAKKYFKKARAMFPELAISGYLGKLWRRMF